MPENTEKKKVTHIKEIELKGLWGKYHVHWVLDPQVNILIGINGSGKSTILNSLHLAFEPWRKMHIPAEIQVTLSDNSKLIRSPKKFDYQPGSTNTPFKALPESLNITAVNTFDSVLLTEEAVQKLSDETVKTNLDWEIFHLQNDYKSYQITIGKRMEALFFSGNDFDPAQAKDRIYGKKHRFEQAINELFEKTGKKIAADKKQQIIFLNQGETISPYELSSGEKQLLIILLKVLLQDNHQHILLMDEPEISLHLSWQVDLIDIIMRLNEHCQIILATHAPGIIKKGWKDKVQRVEYIIKPMN